jgi:hypothetical protein
VMLHTENSDINAKENVQSVISVMEQIIKRMSQV